MQVYDIFILVLLIAATVWGARRGLAKQLATLASLILGYIVAINFRESLAPMIQAAPPWNLFAAMLLLFMGTSLAVWIAFRFVSGGIEKLGLKAFDAQMGGLFGLAKGFLIAMFLTMFAVVMLGDQERHAVLDSFSGYQICQLLNRAHGVVPVEWQQVMEPYLRTLEDQAQFADHVSPLDDLTLSPGDLETHGVRPSQYEDPSFGNMPMPPVGQIIGDVIRANRSADHRDDAQATLREPQIDSRR